MDIGGVVMGSTKAKVTGRKGDAVHVRPGNGAVIAR